jgi:hypothetical protein
MNLMPSRRIILALACVALAAFSPACSIPNLEDPNCTEARQEVKEFYSYHFGNDMKFSQENLKLRERFLTPEFAASLSGRTEESDVFTTGTNDIPKAFRVGSCQATPPDKARVEVLLFWKDDVRSEQRRIYADAVKRGDRWLVDKISGQ